MRCLKLSNPFSTRWRGQQTKGNPAAACSAERCLRCPSFRRACTGKSKHHTEIKGTMSTAGEIQTLGFSSRNAHLLTFLTSLPAYCGTGITKGVLLCIHLFQLITLKPGLNTKKQWTVFEKMQGTAVPVRSTSYSHCLNIQY